MVRVKTVAIVGVAVLTTIGTRYMQVLLEKKISSSDVCKQAVDMMQDHQLSMACLGPPVIVGRPSIFNGFTVVSKSEANIAIPVEGTKTTGRLLISAFKNEENATWDLKCLKLTPKGESDLVIVDEEST